MVRVVVLPTIPNGGEDGVMRQQPCGVKMKESDSHVSLLDFDFQRCDIRLLCFFKFLGVDVSI